VLTEDYFKEFLGVDPDVRLKLLLQLTRGQPHDSFLQIFCCQWPYCNGSWECRRGLLRRLRATRPLRYFRDVESQRSFDELPDIVQVFRGCSQQRIRSLSWTTSRAFAASFVVGQRGSRISDPVIVQAVIAKEWIFTIFAGEGGNEILLDPRQLRLVSELAPKILTESAALIPQAD
jgi:hypothetical protein